MATEYGYCCFECADTFLRLDDNCEWETKPEWRGMMETQLLTA